MVSKSLMLWDWVSLRNEPYKIGALASQSVTLKGYEPSGVLIDCNDINPIPLSAEILEKNGFEKYYMYHTLHDKQVRIEHYWHERRLEIQPYDGEPWIKLAPIYYVHELQHALRLCGLNKLANNFKI